MHENADHLKPGETLSSGYLVAVLIANCEQFRCLDCGAWLSLGPANDADPNVAVEVRAAELAARKFDMEYRLSSRFRTNYGEVAGWRGEESIESLQVVDENGERRTDHNVPLNLDSPNWRAGYLARCIATRDAR
jgi:hypothetical protein